MAPFDLPSNFTVGNESIAINGIGSLFSYANYATGNVFGMALLSVIFIISFLSMMKDNAANAFVSASFISFIFSVYFVRIDLVWPSIPFMLLVLVIFGIIWAKSEKGTT